MPVPSETEGQDQVIGVIRHAAQPPSLATSPEPVAHRVNKHRAKTETVTGNASQLAAIMSANMTNFLLAVLAVLTSNTAVTACFGAGRDPRGGECENMWAS